MGLDGGTWHTVAHTFLDPPVLPTPTRPPKQIARIVHPVTTSSGAKQRVQSIHAAHQRYCDKQVGAARNAVSAAGSEGAAAALPCGIAMPQARPVMPTRLTLKAAHLLPNTHNRLPQTAPNNSWRTTRRGGCWRPRLARAWQRRTCASSCLTSSRCPRSLPERCLTGWAGVNSQTASEGAGAGWRLGGAARQSGRHAVGRRARMWAAGSLGGRSAVTGAFPSISITPTRSLAGSLRPSTSGLLARLLQVQPRVEVRPSAPVAAWKMARDDIERCAFCLDPLAAGEGEERKSSLLLPCGHSFHATCALQILLSE